MKRMYMKDNIHGTKIERVWLVKKHCSFMEQVFYKTKEGNFSTCSVLFTLTKWIQIQNTY